MTHPVTHVVLNRTKQNVQCLWVDYDSDEHLYATVPPGERHNQLSFSTHTWVMRGTGGQVLAVYAGEAAEITLRDGEEGAQIQPAVPVEVIYSHPEWGQYRERGKAEGIPIMAFDCVADEAVEMAAHILIRMLSHCPKELLRRLWDAGADVAIIGCKQVTTDMPPHQYLKGCKTADGRCFDQACRGLGGSVSIPTTTCGEENCTMRGDARYASENVLVHEFGHAVMNIGMSNEQHQEVHRAYEQARAKGVYSLECYMMANADEYWAEGVQAWFHATAREDVNSGIKDRELLRLHDAPLAAILEQTFGASNKWRYTDDCPGTLRPYRSTITAEGQNSMNPHEPTEQLLTIGGSHRTANEGLVERLLMSALASAGDTACWCVPSSRPGRRHGQQPNKRL